MTKRKAMLYPFSLDTVPLVRYRHLLRDYELIHAVAPQGLNMDGKDCCFIDEGTNTGLIATASFDSALEDCDTVIAAEYDFQENEKFFNLVIERLIKAMEKGRHVFCTMLLDEHVLKKLRQHAETNHVDFIYARDQANNDTFADTAMRQTETAIITVLSLCGNCLKFEVQLAIRDYFIKKGLRVSQVGSRHYCELLGFHSFPGFMFGNRYDEQSKIRAFNQYIRDLELAENPDVIIIGVPDGIVQYNERVTNGFGITAYEVGCAIESDYTVLAIPCDGINDEFIEVLAKNLEYRNGMPLDCICMANIGYNKESLNDRLIPSFDVMPDSQVNKAMSLYTLSVPIFKSYIQSQREQLAETIYTQLADNAYKAPMQDY